MGIILPFGTKSKNNGTRKLMITTRKYVYSDEFLMASVKIVTEIDYF